MIDLKINDTLNNKKLNKQSIQKIQRERQAILDSLKFAKDPNIAEFNVNEDDEVIDNINNLYQYLKKQFGVSKHFYYISWDKQKIHQYLIDRFSNKKFVDRSSNDDWWDDVTQFFMDKLHYRTERKEVIAKR